MTIVSAEPRSRGRHRQPDASTGSRRLRRAAARSALGACLLSAVALCCITVLPHAVGWSALVVRSGSMGSAVPVGSLVVARPVAGEGVRVGEPIVVQRRSGDRPTLVLHRVVALTERGGRLFAQLKGDANATPDPDLAPLSGAGSVATPVVTIPDGGYVIAVLDKFRTLLMLLVAAVGALILRGIWSGGAGGGTRGRVRIPTPETDGHGKE